MHARVMTIAMQKCLKKDNEILKYNYEEKSMKGPFIIYADVESFL